MPEVVLKNAQGQLFNVDSLELDAAKRLNPDLTEATPEEVSAYDAAKRERETYGTTGQQAIGAVEQGLRTATFGAIPGLGPGNIERERQLREQSPMVSMLATGVGAAAPALLTGGAAAGLAGAAGLGARGVGLATAVGEGLGGGLAGEVEEARFEQRKVSAGNVLMFGLGGELAGRGVGALTRRALGAVARRTEGEIVQQATGQAAEGVDNLLVKSERRAIVEAADTAQDLDAGPVRDRIVAESKDEIYRVNAERAATALDDVRADFEELGDVSRKPQRYARVIAPTSQAQREWRNEIRDFILDGRDQILRETAPTRAVDVAEVDARIAAKEAALAQAKQLDAPDRIVAPLERELSELKAEGQIAAAPGQRKVSLEGFRGQARGIINDASKALGKADDAQGWFIAADGLKRELQGLKKRIQVAASKAEDPTMHEQLAAQVDALQARVRTDLESTALWGKAGELQRAVNAAWHDQYLKGSMVTERDLARKVSGADYKTGMSRRKYDPAKLRRYLKNDRVGRGLTTENLDAVLDGAEAMAAAHERFGTADAAQIKRLRRNVATVREARKAGDDVQGALSRNADRAAQAKADKATEREVKAAEREASRQERAAEREAAAAEAATMRRGEIMQDIALAGAVTVGGPIAGAAVLASKALRYARLLNTLGDATDGSVRSAARAAIRGASPVVAKVARGAEKAVRAGELPVSVATTTALQRFTGEYATPEQSYEAKREALEAMAADPGLGAQALAASLGDLPAANTQLFADVATRLTVATGYLYQNLPPQLSVGLRNPRGIRPSRQALRDFALNWNSVMMPFTVFQDIRRGMASPKQVRALQAVHPDLHQQLQEELMLAAATIPDEMTTQRKLQLSILFGVDGVAGKAYSMTMQRAAQMLRDQAAEREQQGGRTGSGGARRAPEPAQQPGVLRSLGSSVTTSGG